MSNHLDYYKLISIENLFQAWSEFRKGKSKRSDVQVFERDLEDNLFDLHQKLESKTYKHGSYQSFYVNDPKQRHIHKAGVADRVVHHLLYKFLYDLFDKSFIHDSYSCRLDKGTHKGVKRLEKLTRKVSRNYTASCWALKLDIKKFFASVDHKILKDLIKRRIKDSNILWLISQVIDSFHSVPAEAVGSHPTALSRGMPLGNLTSQVFANIYLDELDQFVKHKMKIRYYLRYADDFIFLADDRDCLSGYIDKIGQFLSTGLRLKLHPKKIILRKLRRGVDFLGYIVLPYYTLPRTKTKRRMFRKLHSRLEDLNKKIISEESFNQSMQSYLGYLSHAKTFRLDQKLKNLALQFRG